MAGSVTGFKAFNPAHHADNVKTSIPVGTQASREAALESAQAAGHVKPGDRVHVSDDHSTVTKLMSPKEFKESLGKDAGMKGMYQTMAFRGANVMREVGNQVMKHPVYAAGFAGAGALGAYTIGEYESKKAEQKGQKEGAQAAMRQMSPQMGQQQYY